MKTTNKITGGICPLNIDLEYYNNLKIAGKIAANTIIMLKESLNKERNTLKLDKLAGEYIKDNNAECTFLNYKGFPRNICISRNNELVHGVAKDIELLDGDLITFDLGVTFKESIADTAATYSVGDYKSNDHKRLVETGKLCLNNAIKSLKIGNKIGSIGYQIYKTAKLNNCNIIDNYGGHFITRNIPHAYPFIGNKSNIDEGIRLQKGSTFAIEPLLVDWLCNTDTKTDKEDNWTVYTNGLSTHEEHTIYVGEEIEVITRRSDEN